MSKLIKVFLFTACLALANLCSYCNGQQPSQCLAYPPELPISPCVSACGPPPTLEPVRMLQPIVMAPSNGPLCVLPTPPLPPPVVISNKCACTKTVVKPELYQRVIQLQRNQNYLRKCFAPVVENLAYTARPL